ncbi:MAG: signal peptide peptidase SppA [Armatimonadota bacterium]|nr:signal peptide peptidase SppA [Armatimonadota bacterium]MDW8026269.1 signal peptide peptidase SppA [Armatimonadota bacterium]
MSERIRERRVSRYGLPIFLGCLGCFGVAVAALGAILALALFVTAPVEGVRGVGVFGGTVGLIKAEGIIVDGLSEYGVVGSESVVRLLEKAREDPFIRAVVIRVNSPGGSASASQEIYQAIKEFKRSGKPIVVSMGEVAASGGFYIASAADAIFASPSTLTGSIGALLTVVNLQELMRKFGVEAETIVSGPFKDTGSFFRKLRPEERQLLKQLTNDVYEQFVNDVASGRNLPISKIKPIADGRILTGRQAHELKLVDKLGGLQDAISYAAERAGIKGKPRIKELRYRRRLWEIITVTPYPSDFRSMLLLDIRLCPTWLLRKFMLGLATEPARMR